MGISIDTISLSNYGFDISNVPTVTNGAYSAGDIMGGLMTFNPVATNDAKFILENILITFKSAVQPNLTAIIFNANPTGTTTTDNAPYSLATTDAFKVRAAIPINATGGIFTDHGTPNTFQVGNLDLPMAPVTGGTAIYLLLIDNTGVTLGSTTDLQVVLSGWGS